MGHLRDYRHGDIFKFPDGTIGIVSNFTSRINPLERHTEDGKYIFLFLNPNGIYYGEIAQGYFISFKDNEYKYIGNIQDIERVI